MGWTWRTVWWRLRTGQAGDQNDLNFSPERCQEEVGSAGCGGIWPSSAWYTRSHVCYSAIPLLAITTLHPHRHSSCCHGYLASRQLWRGSGTSTCRGWLPAGHTHTSKWPPCRPRRSPHHPDHTPLPTGSSTQLQNQAQPTLVKGPLTSH